LFVEQAQQLEPRFLSMIIPARWMAGGRGMDAFRSSMFGDRHLRVLVDYPLATDIFPASSADFEGGACYFLWSGDYDGPCLVKGIRGGAVVESELGLDEFGVFVKDDLAVSILHRVLSRNEESITALLARDTPFGIATNSTNFHETEQQGDIPLY